MGVRLHDSTRRAPWEKNLAAATLTGRANTWWSDEPLIRREGLQWHSGELPWGAQVRQRAAGLVGRLARPGPTLAQRLYEKNGDMGGFLAAGQALVQATGSRLPLPKRKAQQARWKRRIRTALQGDHEHSAAAEIRSPGSHWNPRKRWATGCPPLSTGDLKSFPRAWRLTCLH